MFASLIIERTQLDWSQVPAAVASWVQNAAGPLSALALVIWAIVYVILHPQWFRSDWTALKKLFILLVLLSASCYTIFFFLLLTQKMVTVPNPDPRQPPLQQYNDAQSLFLTLAGAAALFGVLLPFLLDLVQRHFSGRRIWAIALLSLKEAWRRGIVWICLILPIIFLYADWYLPSQAQDQLRSRIGLAYFTMAILFIVTAVLLGAFSIPADIKNQTIHTIVTKPVQRYEIVLGRFIGYALLLLGETAALSALSLVYVVRGITPEAAVESYHAREPLFGQQLSFHGTSRSTEGESVGREWAYRSYISGPGLLSERQEPQFAIWSFNHVPAALAERKTKIPLEFTFDIFRTTKGIENKGVFCTFTFADGRKSMRQIREALKKMEKARADREALLDKTRRKNDPGVKSDPDRFNQELLEKYGVYQISGVEVTDYHTQVLEVPPAIFKKVYDDQEREGTAKKPGDADGKPAPALQILLNVDRTPGSSQQMIGVARRDLYLLVADHPFWLNFFKGALALWLGSCLVLGIAVAGSTYLNGVIAFLGTLFLIGVGLLTDYIRALAEGRTEGGREGGPTASMVRLWERKLINAPLDKTSPGYSTIVVLDDMYRWIMQRVLSIFPDVTRYDLATYVANGFDISLTQFLPLEIVLPFLGYLLPCGILAYYLIKSREIANPT